MWIIEIHGCSQLLALNVTLNSFYREISLGMPWEGQKYWHRFLYETFYNARPLGTHNGPLECMYVYKFIHMLPEYVTRADYEMVGMIIKQISFISFFYFEPYTLDTRYLFSKHYIHYSKTFPSSSPKNVARPNHYIKSF